MHVYLGQSEYETSKRRSGRQGCFWLLLSLLFYFFVCHEIASENVFVLRIKRTRETVLGTYIHTCVKQKEGGVGGKVGTFLQLFSL